MNPIPLRPAFDSPYPSDETVLRAIDKLECGIFGHNPKTALRQGLMGAAMAWTVLIDGRPEAMFGCSTISILDGVGRPWLLMTDEGGKSRRALVRLGRIYTEAIQRQYTQLHNWVHADNATTIRWLSRLGYAVGAVEVIRGHAMRPFIRSVY